MEKAPQAVAFVQPTLARAVEIKNVEPIVSYFCKLHAVKLVLETKLHVSNPEVAEFATNLLTDVETLKSESEPLQTPQAREILADDAASMAYVMDFASKVFDRADKAVREHHITKATAVGFIAASVFLDLERVWQDLSVETAERIKYAKFHAAQILRAIKAGQDPNELYPDEEEDVDGEPFAGEDEELAALEAREESPAGGSIGSDSAVPPAVVVPSTAPDLSDVGGEPLDEPEAPARWPSPPTPKATTPPAPLPKAPVAKPVAPRAPAAPRAPVAPAASYKVEDVLSQNQVIDAAQKHAKYAISALNFEDLTTAMAELTVALGVLKNYDQQQRKAQH